MISPGALGDRRRHRLGSERRDFLDRPLNPIGIGGAFSGGRADHPKQPPQRVVVQAVRDDGLLDFFLQRVALCVTATTC